MSVIVLGYLQLSLPRNKRFKGICFFLRNIPQQSSFSTNKNRNEIEKKMKNVPF